MALRASSSTKQPRHPELARFVNDRAIVRGSYTLVSGRKSSYYCDGKQVSFSSEGLALITNAIAEDLESLGIEIDAVGGMDMGATPIVAALALHMHKLDRPIAAFVVRKEVKEHGTRKEVEGTLPSAPPASRVLMVDDVITSGGSTIKAIQIVRALGHDVVLSMSILDRDSGGREALSAIGVAYQPLVTIAELGITNEES